MSTARQPNDRAAIAGSSRCALANTSTQPTHAFWLYKLSPPPPAYVSDWIAAPSKQHAAKRHKRKRRQQQLGRAQLKGSVELAQAQAPMEQARAVEVGQARPPMEQASKKKREGGESFSGGDLIAHRTTFTVVVKSCFKLKRQECIYIYVKFQQSSTPGQSCILGMEFQIGTFRLTSNARVLFCGRG